MFVENGGEITTQTDEWILYPLYDKSSSKRISRTCNHLVLETKLARDWDNFPQNGIAIATNGFGDQLFLVPFQYDPKILQEVIFIWLHETEEIIKTANSIAELIEN
jgi:hypothetical protein